VTVFRRFFLKKYNSATIEGGELIFLFLRSSKKKLFFLILVSLFAAVFEGSTMAALGLAVSILVDGAPLFLDSMPTVISETVAVNLLNRETESIFLILVIFAVLAQLLKSGLLFLSEWMQLKISYGMRLFVQKRVTNQVLNLEFATVAGISTGELVKSIDQSALIRDICVQLGNLVRATLMAFAYVSVMIVLSVSITMFAAITVLVLWKAVTVAIKRIRKYATDATDAEFEIGRWTVDFLGAIRLIRIFNREEFVEGKINAAWERMTIPELRTDSINIAIPKVLEAITVAGAGIFLAATFIYTAEGKAEAVSALFVYVLIFFRLRPVIKTFNDFRVKIARITPRVERVGDLLCLPRASRNIDSTERENLFRETIEFAGVSFSYPGSKDEIFKNLKCEISRGQMVAIVGPSGSGKTTFIDLILGLQVPTKGEVLIDGQKLNELDAAKWRKQIGVIDQAALLLNMTIEENIAMGRKEVTGPLVKEAAKAAHAEEFIKSFKDEYQTMVGGRGYGLSGGQQQRIALARALAAKPDILVLDEATSALDGRSEKMIQMSIEEMAGTKTIIIISHRISTILGADIVFVLDEGRIIEAGAPADLLAGNGRFKEMGLLQGIQ
jgi:ATP-binding cassette, subfamily B, bacterial MsbA